MWMKSLFLAAMIGLGATGLAFAASTETTQSGSGISGAGVIPKNDGTTAGQVDASSCTDNGTTFSCTEPFGEVIGSIRSYSGTTDTLAATDCGLTVHSTGASAVAETVPNSLPAGCNIAIEAIGAGAVTASAGSGATQHSPCTTVATNHQYAILWVHVESNAGSAAVYDVSGGCT
jgi:hypothetical protein